MKCNWRIKKLSEIAHINPKESIGKGIMAKKIPMDKLQPFCRDITEFIWEEYKGGAKFRNDDTIMARITPCLENGKISKMLVMLIFCIIWFVVHWFVIQQLNLWLGHRVAKEYKLM